MGAGGGGHGVPRLGGHQQCPGLSPPSPYPDPGRRPPTLSPSIQGRLCHPAPRGLWVLGKMGSVKIKMLVSV